MKKIYCFINNRAGVASIEFALLFLPLFLCIMVIVESAILLLQISLIDHGVSNAAKYSSTFRGHVKDRFEEYIKDESNNLLRFIKNPEDMVLDLRYCKTLEQLVGDGCDATELTAELVVYTLKYKINPIFIISRISNAHEFITSKMILVVERAKKDAKDVEEADNG